MTPGRPVPRVRRKHVRFRAEPIRQVSLFPMRAAAEASRRHRGQWLIIQPAAIRGRPADGRTPGLHAHRARRSRALYRACALTGRRCPMPVARARSQRRADRCRIIQVAAIRGMRVVGSIPRLHVRRARPRRGVCRVGDPMGPWLQIAAALVPSRRRASQLPTIRPARPRGKRARGMRAAHRARQMRRRTGGCPAFGLMGPPSQTVIVQALSLLQAAASRTIRGVVIPGARAVGVPGVRPAVQALLDRDRSAAGGRMGQPWLIVAVRERSRAARRVRPSIQVAPIASQLRPGWIPGRVVPTAKRRAGR